MKNNLKVVSINRNQESDLTKILLEKWKHKQALELELLMSGKKKIKKY